MSAQAPQVVWRWPPAIMSRKDLVEAMRGGFDLHVTYTERGNAVYRMSKDGVAAPIGVLSQSVAHRAYIIGTFVRGDALPLWWDTVEKGDGFVAVQLKWHPLTLKPKAKRGCPDRAA